MEWLILALGAAILPAVPHLFDKHVIINAKYDLRAFAVVSALPYVLGMLIVTLPFMKFSSPTMALMSLVVGFIYGIVTYLIYKAYSTEQVSIAMLAYNTYPAFVAAGAWAFLGEQIGVMAIAGILLTVAGVALVSFSSNQWKSTGGIAIIALAIALAVVAQLTTKAVVSSISYCDYLAFSALGQGCFMALLLVQGGVAKKAGSIIGNRKMLAGIVAKEIFWVGSAIMFAAAISIHELSSVSAVSATTPVFIFLGAVVIVALKLVKSDEDIRRRALLIKSLSIAVVILGIALVSI